MFSKLRSVQWFAIDEKPVQGPVETFEAALERGENRPSSSPLFDLTFELYVLRPEYFIISTVFVAWPMRCNEAHRIEISACSYRKLFQHYKKLLVMIRWMSLLPDLSWQTVGTKKRPSSLMKAHL